MTEKKKIDENQIWAIVMTVFPIVILMKAGNEITNNSGMQTLYAALFGGIGGLIGYAANFLTKNRTRGVKIIALIAIIAVSVLTIYLISSKPSDKEILKQNWVIQKIGKIEFESPSKLELQTSEIPESAKWFYSELNLYSDKGNDRLTSFFKTKILNDTLSIEDAYSFTLEGMLQNLDVNQEDVQLDIFGANEKEISCMFSFNLNGIKVNGYGFMYKNANNLESVWLIPLKRGYSKEYIEEFEAGVFPDYQ